MSDELTSMDEINDTAQDIQNKHGVDHDLPGLVSCEDVTLDAHVDDAIRVYPRDNSVEFDVPNQIVWDLKGTWKWRMVALHNPDGEAVEWYGYNNGVLHYWPEYFDAPVWKRSSIYEFSKSWDTDDEFSLGLHVWPVVVDPECEVVG